MCLSQNSLKRAYEYQKHQIPVNLSEICDLIRENTDVYSLTNIKSILRREKQQKYYEYVHELFAILNDVLRIPSIWECPELDKVFMLYDHWWSIIDHENKNYCVNPTKMAQCLLSIIQNGENGLNVLSETEKDQRLKNFLSILLTKNQTSL
jgi:hypothetical protein